MSIALAYSNNKDVTQRSLAQQIAAAQQAQRADEEQQWQDGRAAFFRDIPRDRLQTETMRQAWDVAAAEADADWRELMGPVIDDNAAYERDRADGYRQFWMGLPFCDCANAAERDGYQAATEEYGKSLALPARDWRELSQDILAEKEIR